MNTRSCKLPRPPALPLIVCVCVWGGSLPHTARALDELLCCTRSLASGNPNEPEFLLDAGRRGSGSPNPSKVSDALRCNEGDSGKPKSVFPPSGSNHADASTVAISFASTLSVEDSAPPCTCTGRCDPPTRLSHAAAQAAFSARTRTTHSRMHVMCWPCNNRGSNAPFSRALHRCRHTRRRIVSRPSFTCPPWFHTYVCRPRQDFCCAGGDSRCWSVSPQRGLFTGAIFGPQGVVVSRGDGGGDATGRTEFFVGALCFRAPVAWTAVIGAVFGYVPRHWVRARPPAR